MQQTHLVQGDPMKTLFFVYLALFILMASSCQKSGGSEATVSAVNPNCVTNPSSCNGSAYSQNYGYQPYANSNGYQGGGNSGGYGGGYGGGNGGYGGGYGGNSPFNYHNNNAYLCNCGSGSIPTYNGSNGLGCVQSAGMNFGLYGYAYLGWGSNSWNTLPQLYQYNYGGGSNSRCYNGAVQSCTVGSNPQSCPGGMVCRPNYSGSSIGLCVTSYR